MEQASSRSMLRSFPRVFWVANVMELFERAAYYGMNSVLAVYLSNHIDAGGLGFSEQSVGFMQSIVYALTYVVPILGGALADRYGYRRMLMVAFSLLTAGYYIAGNMSAYAAVFSSMLFIAVGAGLFKPIISGTLAQSTNEENSGFGFGIYYWMINFGAFIAPLLVSYLKGFSWRYVFIASSLYCAAMLLPTLFIYKDPVRTSPVRSLKEVLKSAALVLGDARFMLMIFVYSGFWILYYQNYGSILWYLRDFVDASPVNAMFHSIGIPLDFGAEHVTVINAGIIILCQVVVSRLVKNVRPLPTMIAGMFVGAVGFLLLAFSSNIWIFIAGIAVFSMGEMTAHPKYYSYIGLVAPADKKAIYMGYSFLYGVIGSLIGSNLGGVMYESMLKPVIHSGGAAPVARTFWLIFVALDIVGAIGLLAYNRAFAADTPKANADARKIMIGIYVVLLACGAWFLVSALAGAEADYKTMVQAIIMILIGIGGLLVSFVRR
jgi:proton-dependent oligopeptide transporter, POT family